MLNYQDAQRIARQAELAAMASGRSKSDAVKVYKHRLDELLCRRVRASEIPDRLLHDLSQPPEGFASAALRAAGGA